MKKTLLFALALVFAIGMSSTAFAQDDIENGGNDNHNDSPTTETPSEKKERMLKQFDDVGYARGFVILSFSETISKQQALTVISSHGISLATHTVCSQDGGPQQPPTPPKCQKQDAWNDLIKTAEVTVVPGTEKELASKIYEDPLVVWAEPLQRGEILDEDAKSRMLNVFERGSFENGKIIVSFSDTLTKSDAATLLGEYGLSFTQETFCTGAPGDEQCHTQDSWDSLTNTGTVTVSVGEERSWAELLYDTEDSVVWVEPSFSHSVDSDPKPEIIPKQTDPSTLGNEHTTILLLIVVALGAIVVWRFLVKKK